MELSTAVYICCIYSILNALARTLCSTLIDSEENKTTCNSISGGLICLSCLIMLFLNRKNKNA